MYRYNTFIQNTITNISQLKENGIFMNYAGFKCIDPQVNLDFLTYIGVIRAVKQYRQKLTLKSIRINGHMQPHHFRRKRGHQAFLKAL